MKENQVVVKTALMPVYYTEFRCLMGGCHDDCCGGWDIAFDKKDYLTIKQLSKGKELEELLAKGVRRLRKREHDGLYAEFRLTETGRCAFHTAEGLCRLQLECGERALPSVCRSFPRKTAYTPAAQEHSLSLGCEGVLALLWDLPQGIDFLEVPLPEKEWERRIMPFPVSARFGDIRSLCIDLVQNRSLGLSKRMLLLGLLLRQLRDMDWSSEETVDAWLAKGEALLRDRSVPDLLEQLPGDRSKFLLTNQAVISRAFQVELDEQVIEELLAKGMIAEKESIDRGKQMGLELISALSEGRELKEGRLFVDAHRYQALEAELEELLGHTEYFFENLMVSLIFRRTFPGLKSPEQLWKSYVSLCSLFSVYRFSAVCAMAKEVSRERLFHVLVQVSRCFQGNPLRQQQVRDEFFQNDSASLAHMAILLDC